MEETLILLPGWMGTKQIYKKLIESAPVNCQVVFINYKDIMPGGNLEQFSSGLKEFINRKNLSNISLVGHSLGGAFAIKFAADHPNLIKKLYLVDAEGIRGSEGFFQAFWKTLPRSKNGFLRMLRNLPYLFKHIILNFRLGVFAYTAHLQDEISRIKVSTTIMWGSKDYITPLWQGQKLHQMISGSKFIIVQDVTHHWIFFNPEKFWENFRIDKH
ncbi:alpha/beta hydrolase [Candidatus Daviesbacteria bacterium]|nr:alpha/beta hydrolase [Candidatus Daviesbacteria bacterium]